MRQRVLLNARGLRKPSIHDAVGDSTLDAIPYRIDDPAHRIELKGASMRKRNPLVAESLASAEK